MNTKDITHRFILDKTDIRGEITSLESCFQEAYAHQNIAPSLLPLFGEFLAAASLLSEILKFEGILTLQAKGEGDIGLIMAETDDQGHLRGIVRMADPEAGPKDFSEHSLSQLFPSGHLSITIDPVRGDRYQGIVGLEGATLSECLKEYFAQSEQLATHISLYSDEKRAGGLFLQCLPAQEITDEEAREDSWNTAQQFAVTCKAEEFFETDHDTLLFRLFNEMNCRIFEPKTIQFRCSCSRDRSAQALVSVGADAAYDLLKERDIINIDCQFCGQSYVFTDIDLQTLFAQDNKLH